MPGSVHLACGWRGVAALLPAACRSSREFRQRGNHRQRNSHSGTAKVISRYLRALRGRSPAELRDRAYQNIFILLERGGFLTGQPIVEPARPVRMPNSPREAGFARDFNGRWPTEAAEIVATADRIMLGKFDLLGYT